MLSGSCARHPRRVSYQPATCFNVKKISLHSVIKKQAVEVQLLGVIHDVLASCVFSSTCFSGAIHEKIDRYTLAGIMVHPVYVSRSRVQASGRKKDATGP